MLRIFNLFNKPVKILVEVTICIEKDGDRFYAYSPTLPGFHVDGETEEELISVAKDGILAYLRSLIKHNEPLPINQIITEIPSNASPYKIQERIPVYA